MDAGAAGRTAAAGLASRGLLVRHGSAWRPVGRFERVLVAAAAGRSVVAIGPADPEAAARVLPRLLFGRLGETDEVLDLHPVGGPGPGARYRARLLPVDVAVAGLEELDVGASGGASAPDGPDRVGELLRQGTATIRFEAASVLDPDAPLLQQRLTLVSTAGGDWLVLGPAWRRAGGRRRRPTPPARPARRRRGRSRREAATLAAAPAEPALARRLVAAMLRGRPAVLA